jgi:hypothetical protein
MSTRRKIQLLLWSYFWLLIFEGALRKWVVPGLSTPLLVVRDPIAIMALMLGWPYLTRRPWAGWIGWFFGIGGVAVFFALMAGHRDIFIALYGARILWFHFPLIFLFAAVFARDDVYTFARVTALVAIPMVVLIAMQYSLPQSHFLNVAPGGEEGVGFTGALGKFRPPGTFSFTNGLTEFYAFAAACVVGLVISGPRPLPKWIWLSAASLVAALPISISRGLLFKYVGVIAATVASSVLAGRNIKNLLVGGVMLAGVAFVATRLPVVQDAQRAFEARWESATESEGGEEGVQGVLEKRVGGSTLGAVADAFEAPLLGHGIGLGTNVGAMRATGKKRFLIAEGSWAATIGEVGPILGLILIGMRIALSISLLRKAWTQARRGNALPLILGGFAIALVVWGGTGQPTSLGFLVVGAGLMLAACNPTVAEMLARANRQSSERAGTGVRHHERALSVKTKRYQS